MLARRICGPRGDACATMHSWPTFESALRGQASLRANDILATRVRHRRGQGDALSAARLAHTLPRLDTRLHPAPKLYPGPTRPDPGSTQALPGSTHSLPRLYPTSTQALPILYPGFTQALPTRYPGYPGEPKAVANQPLGVVGSHLRSHSAPLFGGCRGCCATGELYRVCPMPWKKRCTSYLRIVPMHGKLLRFESLPELSACSLLGFFV